MWKSSILSTSATQPVQRSHARTWLAPTTPHPNDFWNQDVQIQPDHSSDPQVVHSVVWDDFKLIRASSRANNNTEQRQMAFSRKPRPCKNLAGPMKYFPCSLSSSQRTCFCLWGHLLCLITTVWGVTALSLFCRSLSRALLCLCSLRRWYSTVGTYEEKETQHSDAYMIMWAAQDVCCS